jgi:hypothetical protein
MHQWINHLPPEDESPAARAGREIGEAAPPLTDEQLHQVDVLLNGPSIPDVKSA